MKNQALFFSKDKSKKLKCRLLQFLFGALRVNSNCLDTRPIHIFDSSIFRFRRSDCPVGDYCILLNSSPHHM